MAGKLDGIWAPTGPAHWHGAVPLATPWNIERAESWWRAFEVLFFCARNPATGLRATGTVKVTIGGKSAPVFFAGAQNGFVGLDQVNTQIPPGLSGTVTLSLYINNQLANSVTLKVG